MVYELHQDQRGCKITYSKDTIQEGSSSEKLLDVRAGTLRALVVGIEVLYLEQGRPGYAVESEALLLLNFGVVEEHVGLARVAKVRAVAHTAEDIQSDAPICLGSRELLNFQLSVEDGNHSIVVAVFKEETRVDGEAPGEPGFDVLHHLLHLFHVAQEQDATVISGHTLDFGDDCIDHSGLVRIECAVEAISFGDDENLAS
jgi:hypothetical protein